MNVLHVCGNPRPISESASKQLAAAFFTKLAEVNPDINVTNVDLYQNPPPYLSNDALKYFWNLSDSYKPTGSEEKASHYSKNQTQLLTDADVLVLTMPMWLYSMPAIVKAWFDQILVPGPVFSLGQSGLIPMHHIKKAILLISSADAFKEDDPDDVLTPTLRAILNMAGISDVAVAWADGQDKSKYMDSAERKAMAVEAAQDLAEEVAEMVQAV